MYPVPGRDATIITGGGLPGADSTTPAPNFTGSNITMFLRNDATASDWSGKVYWDTGMSVKMACTRDPHIVQLVYRTQTNPNGTLLSGTYLAGGTTRPYTTDLNNPNWIVDAFGSPNAFFDESPGSVHITHVDFSMIFDAPRPSDSNTTWQIVAKNFCICNCRVVRVVDWTRGARLDPKTGETPAQFVNIHIEPKPGTLPDATWSDTQLNWMNGQLVKNGFDPVISH